MIHASVLVVMWLSLQVIVNPGSSGAPPAQQEPRSSLQQVSAVSGEVDDIDKVGRNVTIKSKTGAIQTPIYVGPDLPIFDQLSRGDFVTIRFYDSFIVDVTPGERPGLPKDTTAAAQQAHDRADAGVIQQTKLTVTIDAIDTAARVVTFHGADTRRVIRPVQHPQLIEGLKVGDVVTITYTRARAAAIEKGQ